MRLRLESCLTGVARRGRVPFGGWAHHGVLCCHRGARGPGALMVWIKDGGRSPETRSCSTSCGTPHRRQRGWGPCRAGGGMLPVGRRGQGRDDCHCGRSGPLRARLRWGVGGPLPLGRPERGGGIHLRRLGGHVRGGPAPAGSVFRGAAQHRSSDFRRHRRRRRLPSDFSHRRCLGGRVRGGPIPAVRLLRGAAQHRPSGLQSCCRRLRLPS